MSKDAFLNNFIHSNIIKYHHFIFLTSQSIWTAEASKILNISTLFHTKHCLFYLLIYSSHLTAINLHKKIFTCIYHLYSFGVTDKEAGDR